VKTTPEASMSTCVVVMFGPGSSGKSTFMRQMLNHLKNDQLEISGQEIASIVHSNIIQACRWMVSGELKEDTAFKSSDRQLANNKKFKQLTSENGNVMTKELASFLSSLWSEEDFQNSLRKSKSPLLAEKDSIEYFFNSLPHITSPDYVPTLEDTMRYRVRTTGMLSREFQISQANLSLYDVGGSFSQRRAWKHLFDELKDISVLLYFVPLGDYDQPCYHNESLSRLQDSLDCLDLVGNYVSDIPIVLVFTKNDIFEKTFSAENMTEHFPEFKGGSANRAREFIKHVFLEKIKAKNFHEVSIHFCNVLIQDSFLSVAAEMFAIKGKESRNRGRLRQALEELNTSVFIQENSADLFNLKGIILDELHNYKESLWNFRKAVKIDRVFIEGYVNQTLVLNKLGRFKEASEECEITLLLDPNNSKAYSCLADTLVNLKRFEDAIVASEKALELDPQNALAFYTKAKAFRHLGSLISNVFSFTRNVHFKSA
jgi:GTPase SAR1 family protein